MNKHDLANLRVIRARLESFHEMLTDSFIGSNIDTARLVIAPLVQEIDWLDSFIARHKERDNG